MNIKQLCFDLADKIGTSGYEYDAAVAVSEHLKKYMDVKIDKLGNVIGKTAQGNYNILLDAHLDQIGLVVRGFDDKGFVLFDKVGGADVRVLTGAEVILHGKEDIFGVVCSVPPHLAKNDDSKKLDIKQMAVDTGYSKEEVSGLLSIGDRITLRNFQHELLGDKISSGAFDDRCAVAAILYALELVKDKLKNVGITVMFSSREETGGSGAKTGAFTNGCFCDSIVVDVGFGDDPYTSKEETIKLGGGPSIGIAPILDARLTKELVDLAKQKNIPYQHDVMSRTTGTNADHISVTGQGIRTALLSIPLRYMHTANEVISLKDVEYTAKLIAELILKKEVQYNAHLS